MDRDDYGRPGGPNEWRPIPDFEGYYASSAGEIRGPSGQIVKQTIANKVYRKLSLYVGGVRYDKTAHRLIASAFHGPCPEGHVCCHLNGDPADNRPSNLKWATPKENEQHKPDRLTLKQIKDIHDARQHHSLDQIASNFGVKRETVEQIANLLPQPAGLGHAVSVPDAWAKHRLCYVTGNWAYFTSADLEKQWGDDWDDAPYEHNAEPPYEREPGQIVRIAWDGDYCTPDFRYTNSPWSVEEINAGATPWLVAGWFSHGDSVEAGATIAEFCDAIMKHDGTVYFPAQRIAARSDETPQEVQPERQEPDPQDAPTGGHDD